MVKTEKPVPPCRGCEDRHAGCHNDSCPHGWAEYEAAHHAFRQEVLEHCEMAAATHTTRGKKRAIRTWANEKKGWKK